MEVPDFDALAQEAGFRDGRELSFCISSIDISGAEALAAFDAWKCNDGSKAGLLAAFPQLQRLQRAGDIS